MVDQVRAVLDVESARKADEVGSSGRRNPFNISPSSFLLRGTNSILRTFLGGTFREKHPVVIIIGDNDNNLIMIIITMIRIMR